ncbi:hypothetical protein AAH169_21560, partial [Bacteroides ovatus]
YPETWFGKRYHCGSLFTWFGQHRHVHPILKLLGDFHPIVLKMLPSLLPPEMAGLAGFLEPLIDMLFITWPECALLVQSFDLGLDLVPQN